MIVDAKEALYYALTHDSTLTSLLGAGQRVFGSWPQSLDVMPCITFCVITSGLEHAMSDRSVTDFQVDVWGQYQSETVDQIAERIHDVLHRKTITISGAVKSFLCTCGQIREGFEENLRHLSMDITIHTQN